MSKRKWLETFIKITLITVSLRTSGFQRQCCKLSNYFKYVKQPPGNFLATFLYFPSLQCAFQEPCFMWAACLMISHTAGLQRGFNAAQKQNTSCPKLEASEPIVHHYNLVKRQCLKLFLSFHGRLSLWIQVICFLSLHSSDFCLRISLTAPKQKMYPPSDSSPRDCLCTIVALSRCLVSARKRFLMTSQFNVIFISRLKCL